jgi:RNA polymerase sigma factor (sigma-70 family)
VGTTSRNDLTERADVAELVCSARGGDDASFAALVRAFQDVAVAYATAILRDYHLAEDAAQEAFVEAYRELGSLREPAAFPAWLATIVFKQCDRITRRKRLPVAGLDAALDVASPEPSPHEALERGETRALVQRAVAALADHEREVVLLYYMGERSHAEIAEFLGVTTNTVKTRLYAARRRLRRSMDEIESGLHAARPSSDPRFAERVARLIRPEGLAKRAPMFWTPGMGADLWELFCAAITGDLEAIRRLLDRDPALVRAWWEYRTPLSFAVRENQLDAAALLLERGANPIESGTPDTLLQIARDRGYVEMERLLEGAITRGRGAPRDGEPIAEAIRRRDRRAVRRLLDASPRLVHAVDERSNRPIHWAVMTRQPDVIDELLARGADVNVEREDGARPIHLVGGDYHFRGWRDVLAGAPTAEDIYRHLVARGAAVDIAVAAGMGDVERVRALLGRDPGLANRVSSYGDAGAPLTNAAAAGHREIVELLLARGADPNLPEPGIAPRGHALYKAVAHGHYEIARLLLEHGAHPNVEVESSADTLSRALTSDDQRMVELLCSYGAARPVHLLAHYNDIRTAAAVFAANPALADDGAALGSAGEAFVRLMLRYQPDLPKRVTVAKSRALTELLFRHGMDPSRPDWLRITPLHRFAEFGDVEHATQFIDHGADLHARDEEFRSTPLGWAAKYGQLRMVELLLRRGARPTLPDDPPWATPLAWATRRGHAEIARVLTEFERTRRPPPHRLEEYEAVARALVEAYASGDDEATRRVADHFQVARPLMWDRPPREVRTTRLRRAVRERLAGRPTAAADGDALAADDARYLVARSLGFESWDALAREADAGRATLG